MYVLRKYQLEGTHACTDILTSKRKSCKELVVAPTGGGKSIIIAKTVESIDEPILILQPSKELLSQNFSKFKNVGGKATMCCASLKTQTIKGEDYTELDGETVKCREISKVTYATIGTVKKYKEELKKLGVRKAIIDECFPGNTPVNTEEGLIKIKDIVKRLEKGQKLPKAKSYNEKTGEFEYNSIINGKKTGKKLVVRTQFTKGYIESTWNHKVLTTVGWKKIEELKIGDALMTSYEESGSGYLYLSDDQKAIIVGGGIGDGSFDFRKKGSNCARMKFLQGKKQEAYLRWKSKMLTKNGEVRCIEKNGYAQKEAYTFTSQCFYMPEDSKNDEWLINNIDAKSLAVLWMDDGHMSKLENAGSLYTFCHNKDSLTKLQIKIEELGIKGTVLSEGKSSSSGTPLCYLRFTKESIQCISNLCAEYVHPSLSFKINSENRSRVGTYQWKNSPKGIVKIVKSLKEVGEQEVFDIEVENNHNFIVSSKSAYKKQNSEDKISIEGVVVHNCHLATKSNSQIRNLFKEIGITHVVGLTATPIYLQGGMDGASLKMMNRVRGKMFSDIKHVTQISELVEQNFWSKLLYQVNDTDETYLRENSNGSDFTVESQKEYYKANNLKGQIAEEVENLLGNGRKSILIFVPTIQEAEELNSIIPNSATVHSKMPQDVRDYVVKGFRELDIPVVINVGVLIFGFDHPELDAVITARSTSSIAIYYQSLGRGVRIHPHKKDCKIVDFSGNVKRFGRLEGLHFEKIEGYGWGMFDLENRLLTDYPIKAKKRPTKDSLIQKHRGIVKDPNFYIKKEDLGLKMWFGKHEGKTLKWVVENDKGYAAWIYDMFEFKTPKMIKMKHHLEDLLGLPKTK